MIKKLLSISMVSEIVSLHPQTIRHYERVGLITPERTEGNSRRYDVDHVEQLKYIVYLTREMKINISGVELIISLKNEIEELKKSKK